MKSFYLSLLAIFFIASCSNDSTETVENNKIEEIDPIDQKVDSLFALMSQEEKIGQLAQRGTSSRSKATISPELKVALQKGKIGSFLNIMDTEVRDGLQRIAMEESPHGIPLIFGRDVIHGFRTIFPIPLGQAATWNLEIVELGAAIAAREASSYGVDWTFAPMVDIARDPRWGRIAESCGEDPYLSSVMGVAMVNGFQGDDLAGDESIAACAKHFAGYGAAEGGRDYNTAIISEEQMRNIYLKPFEACNEAGVATYMASFNEINGVPSSGSNYLLDQVLRDEWKFDGFVVSDWNSITEMIPHGFCKDEKEAAMKAINAGLDMEMTSQSYDNHLNDLIVEGQVDQEKLDRAVKNILRIKFRMGLFDNPYINVRKDSVILRSDHKEAALAAATESIVLLKNNKNILPLNSKVKTVAVIGPLADAPYEQLGTWVFDGMEENSITPKAAFEYSRKVKMNYAAGTEYSRSNSMEGKKAAVLAAQKSDVILFFGGEESILSGEAHSRANINLPGAQEQLIKELKKTGKPIVLVVMAGRPITFENIIDDVDAILFAWHPGTMAGPALSRVIMGEESPSGRLPVTFPKVVGQVPFYYNHKHTGRPVIPEKYVGLDDIPLAAKQSSLGNTSHYLDAGYEPRWPFGFGLTYSTFEYSEIEISDTILSSELKGEDGTTISAVITNTGNRNASEVVQFYIQDEFGSITRPVKELKGFEKITLDAGESLAVEFKVSLEDLKYHNGESWVIEKGSFNAWIGPNAMEGLKTKFVYQ